MKRNSMGLLLALLWLPFVAIGQNKADKMTWWKEAKYGMFIHWGLYSVPAGVHNGVQADWYSEWIQSTLKIPVTDYAQYAARFNPQQFDAEAWVKLAKAAGMKYMVFTAKHHEGFAMFDSKASDFDIMDASPYGKDIVAALAKACKKHGMPFGLYYSQAQDWHHRGGSAMNGQWDDAQKGDMDKYLDEVAVPQVKEILSNYGDIKILWWDTPTGMNPDRAAKFLPELAKHPNLIYNDRLGGNVHGDLETPEQYIPATGIPGKNWEACMTMNESWGYKSSDNKWKNAGVIVRNLVDIASKGGNYLLNVGPTAQGIIPQPSVEILTQVGQWMDTNGEAIYGTSASPYRRLDWNGRCTQKMVGKKHMLYLHVYDMPSDGVLKLQGMGTKVKKAYALNNKKHPLPVEINRTNVNISLERVKADDFVTVIALEMDASPVVYNAPDIEAETLLFIRQAKVILKNHVPNGVIHYTTDGSVPSMLSPVGDGEIVIKDNDSFVLKALVFVDGMPVSGLTEKSFSKAVPQKSLAVTDVNEGLKFKYFEGEWNLLPKFEELEVVNSGVAKGLDLNVSSVKKNYGLVFDGYLNVPESGVYLFSLASDDGSVLTIAGNTLMNDGLHGMGEKKIEMVLEKGFHPFELKFFQKDRNQGLRLKWSTGGAKYVEVPMGNYFH